MLVELGCLACNDEATIKHPQYLAKKLKDKFQGKVPAKWEEVVQDLVE